MKLGQNLPTISFALVIIAGCGGGTPDRKEVPVAGVVTLNGEPLEGAEISFLHEQHPVGMITGTGGKYNIPTGVVPGEYKVTISKVEGMENIPEGIAIGYAPGDPKHPETLPPQYSNPRLTKLKITIPPEGTETANFDLRTE